MANWKKYNPVLADGEMIMIATDASNPTNYNKWACGDGSKAFTSLVLHDYGGEGSPCLQDFGNDTLLPMSQDAITRLLGNGYIFKGLATPTTNPGTPDGNVYYFALEEGEYVNFGGASLENGLAILNWDGSKWNMQKIFKLAKDLGNSETDIMSQKAVTDNLVAQIVKYEDKSDVKSDNAQDIIDYIITRIFGLDLDVNGISQPTLNDAIEGYYINAGNKWVEVAGETSYCIYVGNLKGKSITMHVQTYAFLKSNDLVVDKVVPLANDCTRIFGSPTNVTIPSDANYICVLASSQPTIIEVDIKKDIRTEVSEKVDESKILDYISTNLANPENFAFGIRYSVAAKKIIKTSGENAFSSGLIPVKEGETYIISGAFYGITSTPQGGYFGESATGKIGDAAVDNITFIEPVNSNGKIFVVPTGKDIKYVILNIRTEDDATATGNVQVELGEIASDYTPYDLKPYIKEELIQGGTNTDVDKTLFDDYKNLNILKYPGISDKIPNFRKHYILKDKDLVVINTGTSLTARNYCSNHEDGAEYRPPLLETKNLASYIWDKIRWQGQEYRRYDAKISKEGSDKMFTETGTFNTSATDSAWDDSTYRNSLTRYSDTANASVQFVVPKDAWQFNFIYRTATDGTDKCVIEIAEGDGKMVVWDGSDWVEANGYNFSMKDEGVVTIPTVRYKDPSDREVKTRSNYPVRGNTVFQKRLKMKAVEHYRYDPKDKSVITEGSDKTITIKSVNDGRFLYWGVEWSVREFMITYINSARGSHNSSIGFSESSNRSLLKFQDNEIWEFNPDLLLTEDPIHNSGGGGAPDRYRNKDYYWETTKNFFFGDGEIQPAVSLKNRCAELGKEFPELAIHNTSITFTDNAIDSNGNLVKGEMGDNLVWTALDAQSSVWQNMLIEHPDIIYINAVANWVECCYKSFGNMSLACAKSGYNGDTLTYDGTHWNDNGSLVMARVILPILDFIL